MILTKNPKAIASSNNSDAKLKAVLEAVEKEGEYDPHILDDYSKPLIRQSTCDL